MSFLPWKIFKYVNGKIQYDVIVFYLYRKCIPLKTLLCLLFISLVPILCICLLHILFLNFMIDAKIVFKFPLLTVSSLAPLTYDFLMSPLTISSGLILVPLLSS